jgi:uncharacterized protein (TIGR00725 family)
VSPDATWVAVVGPGDAPPDAEAAAEAVGAGLARAGAVVVCGGRGGAMEAACRGARAEGGTTVGILPGADRAEANPYVDIAIPTGLGELRNGLVVRAADAVIAVAGEYGTLSEIGFALKTGKPVVGLGTWELARGGEPDAGIVVASDPAEAVERALALARR